MSRREFRDQKTDRRRDGRGEVEEINLTLQFQLDKVKMKG